MKILFLSGLGSATKKNMPSLFHAIMGIIGASSQEKVRWSDTISYIAFMKNALSICNRSIMNHPRVTMSQYSDPLYDNDPVSSYRKSAFPKPACIRLFYVAKKSFFFVSKRILPTGSAQRAFPMIRKNFIARNTKFSHMLSEPIIP